MPCSMKMVFSWDGPSWSLNMKVRRLPLLKNMHLCFRQHSTCTRPHRWLIGSSSSMRWRRRPASLASRITSAHCCTCSVTVWGSGRSSSEEDDANTTGDGEAAGATRPPRPRDPRAERGGRQLCFFWYTDFHDTEPADAPRARAGTVSVGAGATHAISRRRALCVLAGVFRAARVPAVAGRLASDWSARGRCGSMTIGFATGRRSIQFL